MNRFLGFLVRHHRAASLATVMIVLLGAHAMISLRRDQFPRIDLAQIDIRTVYPGASPEDVELSVTNRIEEALKGVAGIRGFVSASFENRSEITVDLDPDVRGRAKAAKAVRDAVAGVTDLPAGVTRAPEVDELSTDNIPIIEVAVSGDLFYRALRSEAAAIEDAIKTADGVSHVTRVGWRAREIRIDVSPEALERAQVPLPQVAAAIAAANVRLSGGTFRAAAGEENLVTQARFSDPTEAGDVIVRSGFDGPQVRVRDLAVISDDFEDETLLTRVDGAAAISFVVFKKEGADTVRASDAVKAAIRARARSLSGRQEPAREGLPARAAALFGPSPDSETGIDVGRVRVSYANETAPGVRARFAMVLSNGLMGLALVVLVLALFLDLRTSAWVSVSIPVAVFGTCAALRLSGGFLDSISLAALVLVIGMVVDNGIIFSEAIAENRARGLSMVEAAVAGVRANLLPVTTTVTTTIAAFLPLLFIKGVIGQFVSTIPLVVAVALLVSLAEAVVGLPAHLVAGAERRSSARPVRAWFAAVRAAFERLANLLLRFRYLLVPAFVALAAAAVWYAANRMSFVLFPTRGADRFFINMELPMGSSLGATSEKVKEVERLVARLPAGEVENTLTRVGTAGYPPFGQAGNYAMITVRLVPNSRQARGADRIVEDLRAETDRLEGYVRIAYDIDAGGVPVGEPIALRVVGSDDGARAGLARRVEALLAAAPGVKDVMSDDVRGKDQLTLQLDRPALARLGLTAAAVAGTVRLAWDGEVATTLRQGDEDVGFRVRLAPASLRDEEALARLRVANDQGRLVRLAEAARFGEDPAPNAWRHHDGQRAITITAGIDAEVTTPLETVERVLAQLEPAGDRPGARVVVSGEAAQSRLSMAGLLAAFGLAVAGIYFLLVLQLDSFAQPLLVLVTVPFGIVGVIVTLAAHGEPLGFLAVVGTIGLAGVVVNDAIVLVSHLNSLRRKHPEAGPAEIRAMVASGTADRLRAVILTTVTTTAGMIPLAYGLGGYDLYMAPMALTLGYGLLFATPLTLILLPALYLTGMDLGRRLHRRRPAVAAVPSVSGGGE